MVTGDGVNDALAMTFFEFVHSLFKTTPLSGIHWLSVVVGFAATSGWMEIKIAWDANVT